MRIQAGNRFIQHNQLLRRTQCTCQQHTLLLPAGQFPVTPARQGSQLQPLHVLCGHLPVFPVVKRPAPHAPLAAGQHDFAHRRGKIPLHIRLLRQVSDLVLLQPVTECNLPGQRFLQAKNGLHQGRFSRSVLADNAQVIACTHFKTDAGQHGMSVISEHQVLASQ